MSYQIPCSPAVAETEEKKSRFICWLFPVESKAAFQQQLDAARTQYPDASHHCTALIIGNPSNPEVMQSDDDGEPGGSAGRPMLEFLLKQEVGNVGAIVIRYFGGTKLGVGGLMRAYRGAVGAALQSVELRLFVPLVAVRVACNFAQESRLRFLVGRHAGNCADADYSDKVTIALQLPQDQWPVLKEQLAAENFQVLAD